MTYVPTWAGFIFLAIVLDPRSHRVVGWVIGEPMTRDLVPAALSVVDQHRKPAGVIHHSDQGRTSVAFGQRCGKLGVRPSMGSAGDACDDAFTESLFASLECEPIDRRGSETKSEGRLALFSYIKGGQNPRRRHSALGRISPTNFERNHANRPEPYSLNGPA